MTMPNFTLNDHIGWATTRYIPLCPQAVTALMTLVSGTFTDFLTGFAGLNTSNNLSYCYPLNNISDNQAFFDAAQGVIIPHNLLNFIESEYLANGTAFTSQMITNLLAAVSATPEFSSFLTALNGITPGNCLNYVMTINQLLACPKFLFDVMGYAVP